MRLFNRFGIDFNVPQWDGDDCLEGLSLKEALRLGRKYKYGMVFIRIGKVVIDLWEFKGGVRI